MWWLCQKCVWNIFYTRIYLNAHERQEHIHIQRIEINYYFKLAKWMNEWMQHYYLDRNKLTAHFFDHFSIFKCFFMHCDQYISDRFSRLLCICKATNYFMMINEMTKIYDWNKFKWWTHVYKMCNKNNVHFIFSKQN